MGAEEFWHGEPWLAGAYREAESIRRDNAYAAEWRTGYYVVEALLAAAPAINPFAAKSAREYPRKPLFGSMAEKPMTEEEKRREAMERNKALFMAMAEKANEKLAERASSKG